ncbi:MAG: universal stress protein [Methylocystaceae bacterium]
MFNKLLIPVDGSDAALKAVETARKMMEEGSAQEVILLHVIHPSEVMLVNELNLPAGYPVFYEELNKTAKQILENAKARFEENQPITVLLENGPPAEVICRIAERDKCDLIIMGNRGLNRIQRVLLGSISSKVTTLAHCSVLVVK